MVRDVRIQEGIITASRRSAALDGYNVSSPALEAIESEFGQYLSATSTIFRCNFSDAEHFAGDEWIPSRQVFNIHAVPLRRSISLAPILDKTPVFTEGLQPGFERGSLVELQQAECFHQASSLCRGQVLIHLDPSFEKTDLASIVGNGKRIGDKLLAFLQIREGGRQA